MNQATLDLFGYTRDEVLHIRSVLDLYVNPEDRNRILKNLEAKGSLKDIEVRLRKKDGSEIDCLISMNAFQFKDGSPAEYHAIIRDITQSKRMESELRVARDHLEKQVKIQAEKLKKTNEQLRNESTGHRQAEKAREQIEKRYWILAENMSDVIWILDMKGRHTYLSPSVESLSGFTPEEIMNMDPSAFVAPSSLEKAMTAFQEALATHESKDKEATRHSQSQTMELEYLHKDGSSFFTEVRWFVLGDSEGKPTGIMGVTRDISERKKLEDQLLQSQKLESLGRLAGGIAHDFNNLMTALANYSDLLLADLDQGTPLYENVNEIKEIGNRASALTHQLLTFGMKQERKLELIDLNATVRGMESMLRRLIGEDVILEISFSTEKVNIIADRGQIEQVLVNLAINARDAMPGGGTLTIETTRTNPGHKGNRKAIAPESESWVGLTVKDTGEGMNRKTLSHIFDPFFTTKEQGKGTGLGLSTVYGIVKQSGGEIEVQSEPGSGTNFRVNFPGTDIQDIEPCERNTVFPINDYMGSETILLVEDEDLVRNPLSFILNQKGYNVIEACNGELALEICMNRQDSIHLMITDIVMPKMNGLDLAKNAIHARPDLKVLYVSGYHQYSNQTIKRLDPENNFLPKPFSPFQILKKIRCILDSSQDPC